MAASKTEQVPLSTKIGGQLQIAEDASVLTDAMVSDTTTITSLISSLATPLASDGPIKTHCTLALKKAIDLSLISETGAYSTVAEIIALTDAAVGEKPGFFN